MINVDLPGFDPSTVDITAEKDVLTVKAERHWEPMEGDEVVAAERTQGQFFRHVFLGEGLDTENIHATYDNGVLMVTIPLIERAEAAPDRGDPGRRAPSGHRGREPLSRRLLARPSRPRESRLREVRRRSAMDVFAVLVLFGLGIYALLLIGDCFVDLVREVRASSRSGSVWGSHGSPI